jgi:predicted nuclease with TOPRIM domain
VNIDQIETLYQAMETLKKQRTISVGEYMKSVDEYVKATGALSRALRNNWPALRDELRRLQAAIEKAREALSYLPYESALRLRERIREGLAALDEPASDAVHALDELEDDE